MFTRSALPLLTLLVAVGCSASDVTLDPPGPGESVAFGHCRLDLASGVGLRTFKGGTGKITWFEASANVASLGRPKWSWTGRYRFSPHD